MSEFPLTYQDLLSLYRGKGTAVEQLTSEVIAAIAIETPLTEFLRKADVSSSPRHIVLTGNAGDGKTFAAIASRTQSFSVTPDASAGEEGRGASPIDDLAEKLTAQLRRGERLLVAINRGQFERLDARVRRGADPALTAFIAEARAQTTLRESWPERSPEVALVDLGLLNTSSRGVLDRIVEKVTTVVSSEGISDPTKTAFQAAQASLRTETVRSYLHGVLRFAWTRGQHVTMRQLWSFVAFLATGARSPDSDVPPTLEDAVGARLFSESAEGPVFDSARDLADPATVPQARLARLALLGRLGSEVLTAIPELRDGVALPPDSDLAGELLTRIAAVHGVAEAARRLPVVQDRFTLAVETLTRKGHGWAALPTVTTPLLKGIYRVLGLWCGGNSFPAWQTLCFDSARLPRATSVASAEIDPRSLRLAVPRPSPWAEEALVDLWRPPYIWLSAVGDQTGRETARLRLSPRLFELLYAEDDPKNKPTRSDLLTLQRWLAEFPSEHRRPSDLRLGRREQSGPLQFTEDPLANQTLVGWEGRS